MLVASIERTFQALCQMARYRGLQVAEERSSATVSPSRRTFRVVAHSPANTEGGGGVRFVALFADYNAAELRRPRPNAQPRSVRPTDRSVDEAIRRAHAETEDLGGRLDVVLLHAEAIVDAAKLTVGIDARFFIDHLRLDRARANIVNCDLWHVRQLHIDVLGNNDVPTHRRATEEERARYRPNDLPLLLLDDPARRWHGFLIDEIVAIDYDDADVGHFTQLRRVSERAGPGNPLAPAPVLA